MPQTSILYSTQSVTIPFSHLLPSYFCSIHILNFPLPLASSSSPCFPHSSLFSFPSPPTLFHLIPISILPISLLLFHPTFSFPPYILSFHSFRKFSLFILPIFRLSSIFYPHFFSPLTDAGKTKIKVLNFITLAI